MRIEREITMPIMPNFLRFKQEPGLRQDGFNKGEIIPVGSLTEEQANQFADEWKEAFIQHWKSKI